MNGRPLIFQGTIFLVRFSMNKPPAMLVVGILALASSKKPPVINYICYNFVTSHLDFCYLYVMINAQMEG